MALKMSQFRKLHKQKVIEMVPPRNTNYSFKAYPQKIVFKQCVRDNLTSIQKDNRKGETASKNNTDHGHEAQEDHYLDDTLVSNMISRVPVTQPSKKEIFFQSSKGLN